MKIDLPLYLINPETGAAAVSVGLIDGFPVLSFHTPDGATSLQLFGGPTPRLVVLNPATGEDAAELSADPDGSYLTLRDREGRDGLVLFAGDRGGTLVIQNPDTELVGVELRLDGENAGEFSLHQTHAPAHDFLPSLRLGFTK